MTRPTVSQLRGWQPESLRRLADTWDVAAGQLHGEVVAPDIEWSGAAAAAGQENMTGIVASATAAARSLIAAAAAARAGADRIAAARTRALDIVAAAEAEGFQIAEDGSARPLAAAAELLHLLCPDDAAVQAMLSRRATEFTARIDIALDALSAADTDTARDIAAALDAPAADERTGAASAAERVAQWPTMSQADIAGQIAALTPEQRRELVTAEPRSTGNTDGVPWQLRAAANRINIADAILAERRIIDRPDDEKIRSVVAERYGARLQPFGAEQAESAIAANPARRAAAIAEHDRDALHRKSFYEGLLADDRQILAFDPARSALIELRGNLDTATSIGVLVPGLNTTMLDSDANISTVNRFVTATGGEVAMISYLGGPFPTGGLLTGLPAAADPRYALEMAPRLVAFSEDVDRVAGDRPVTYLGHSYGGSILGTAERLGLTADRTVYVEAAGAGVGVYQVEDWRNRNPDVERYSMTAPADPIELVQGLPLGTHGADPDEMPGVIRLDTGRRSDGSVMGGWSAHSDVLNDPSDAWRNLLDVITGRRAG